MCVCIMSSIIGCLSVLSVLQGCTGAVTTSRSTMSRATPPTGTPPTVWYKEDIPNPRTDTWACGRRGKPSWICNPNNIITDHQADDLDVIVEDIRANTDGCHCEKPSDCPSASHGGYKIGVAILNKINIRPNPTRDEKLDIAESYADFLRDESWQLGACDDDLVILVVKDDRVVYTKTGDAVSTTLPDSCTDEIFAKYKNTFTEGNYSEGLRSMLGDYKLILTGTESCGSETAGWVTGIIVAVCGVGILGAVIVVALCQRRGRCKSSGGGGGAYSSPSHQEHHVTHHTSRDSVSSASSGGGGGDF